MSRGVAGPGLGVVAGLVLVIVLGSRGLDDFELGLGVVGFPSRASLAAHSVWLTVGLFVAGYAALLFARLGDAGRLAPLERLATVPRRPWVAAWALVAAGLCVAVRTFVLEGAEISDDESAYRFTAELLLGGRLSVPSPELKLFFDRQFMVNDGHLYSQYPVGWPLLLSFGLVLGVPGLVNPLMVALTVPAVAWLCDRYAGEGWGRLGAVLFALSPMVVFTGATLTSHPSCTALLAWLLVLATRAADGPSGPRLAAGVAALFALAVLVRPTSGFFLGLPALGAWAHGWWRHGERRLASAAAFAGVGAAGLAALLAYNWGTTGSPWLMPYVRYLRYAAENEYRFAVLERDQVLPNMEFGDPLGRLFIVGSALLRLNAELLPWPMALGLLPLAFRAGTRLPWLGVGAFFGFHAFSANVGIDTVASMHFFEPVVPLVVLSVAGLSHLVAQQPALGLPRSATWATWGALAGLTLVGLGSMVPARARVVRRVADDVLRPTRAVEAEKLGRALVFSPLPFAPPCAASPSRHFRFFRPNNSPWLDDELLWVNHLDQEADRRLASLLPDRRAVVLTYTADCQVRLLPVDSPALKDVGPNGLLSR